MAYRMFILDIGDVQRSRICLIIDNLLPKIHLREFILIALTKNVD